MVNEGQIHKLLKEYFQIDGDYSLDEQGKVGVDGSVKLIRVVNKLPVRFGEIGGDFICEGNHLTTLENAPGSVRGRFNCHDNEITSLVGAPTRVGWVFDCSYNKLTSLKGAPKSVEYEFVCNRNPLVSLEGAPEGTDTIFICDYNNQLPLLRLINYDTVEFINDVPLKVYEILKKYSGQGKKGAIKAAAELIKAGYKDNARW